MYQLFCSIIIIIYFVSSETQKIQKKTKKICLQSPFEVLKESLKFFPFKGEDSCYTKTNLLYFELLTLDSYNS